MEKIKLLSLKHKVLNKLQKYLPFIDSDKMIYSFIEKEFSAVTNGYAVSKKAETPAQTSGSIWLFWWQGYENAPPLVRICIDSVKKNAGSHEVVILTQENWKDFAEIPEYIIKKLYEKKISLTHFSDILRMELLSRHGGLWLDATVFVSRKIPEEYFSLPYFTVRYSSSSSRIAHGQWTGFCQGAHTSQIVHLYCRDIFFEYWKKFDSLIDYFLIDYVMRYGYEQIADFKALVDSVPENNGGIKLLDKHFNDEYSEKKLDQILESSVFFKLNWKRNYLKETHYGKPTIYGKFII